MTSICSKTSFSISSYLDVYMHFSVDLDRPKKDAEQGNDPVAFGEWSLATQFNANTTDAFRRKWADAQKLTYEKTLGWMVGVLDLRTERE